MNKLSKLEKISDGIFQYPLQVTGVHRTPNNLMAKVIIVGDSISIEIWTVKDDGSPDNVVMQQTYGKGSIYAIIALNAFDAPIGQILKLINNE